MPPARPSSAAEAFAPLAAEAHSLVHRLSLGEVLPDFAEEPDMPVPTLRTRGRAMSNVI